MLKAKEHQKTKTIYYKQNLFSKKNCFHKYWPLSHVFTFKPTIFFLLIMNQQHFLSLSWISCHKMVTSLQCIDLTLLQVKSNNIPGGNLSHHKTLLTEASSLDGNLKGNLQNKWLPNCHLVQQNICKPQISCFWSTAMIGVHLRPWVELVLTYKKVKRINITFTVYTLNFLIHIFDKFWLDSHFKWRQGHNFLFFSIKLSILEISKWSL